MYKDFKEDSSISWLLNPAVRTVDGDCIEEQGCDWELTTLCAFNQTADVQIHVNYLACMDERVGTAKSAGTYCAKGSSLDNDAIGACFAGAAGQALMAEAAANFNAQFPARATVPHTFVGSTDVQAGYATLKTELCKQGSKAAACGSSTSCEV